MHELLYFVVGLLVRCRRKESSRSASHLYEFLVYSAQRLDLSVC